MDVGCDIYARGKQQEMEGKSGQETEHEEIIHDEDTNENSDNVAQTVGHNMYILAYQVQILTKSRAFFVHCNKRECCQLHRIFVFSYCTTNRKVFSGIPRGQIQESSQSTKTIFSLSRNTFRLIHGDGKHIC